MQLPTHDFGFRSLPQAISVKRAVLARRRAVQCIDCNDERDASFPRTSPRPPLSPRSLPRSAFHHVPLTSGPKLAASWPYKRHPSTTNKIKITLTKHTKVGKRECVCECVWTRPVCVGSVGKGLCVVSCGTSESFQRTSRTAILNQDTVVMSTSGVRHFAPRCGCGRRAVGCVSCVCWAFFNPPLALK